MHCIFTFIDRACRDVACPTQTIRSSLHCAVSLSEKRYEAACVCIVVIVESRNLGRFRLSVFVCVFIGFRGHSVLPDERTNRFGSRRMPRAAVRESHTQLRTSDHLRPVPRLRERIHGNRFGPFSFLLFIPCQIFEPSYIVFSHPSHILSCS